MAMAAALGRLLEALPNGTMTEAFSVFQAVQSRQLVIRVRSARFLDLHCFW
jgi:hypothetical protein